MESFIKPPGNFSKEAQLKHSEDYALKIVTFLIDERKINEETFLLLLNHINPEHYQDIVDERAIIKMCGYPVCGNKLIQVPEKQFHISLKFKQVLDITDRKNYCSNFCFKSSIYIKKQIDTSILWLRKQENSKKILFLKKTDKSIGENINALDINLSNKIKETNIFLTKAEFQKQIEIPTQKIEPNDKNTSNYILHTSNTLQNDFPKISNTISTKEINLEHLEKVIKKINCKKQETGSILIETSINPENNRNMSNSIKTQISAQKPIENDANCKDLNKILNKLKNKDATNKQTALTASVNACNTLTVAKTIETIKAPLITKKSINFEQLFDDIKAWFTLETFVFIYGENRIKHLLINTDFDQLIIADENPIKTDFNRSKAPKLYKSIPNFDELKNESVCMDLKVKAFYNCAKSDVATDDGVEDGETFSGEAVAVLPLIDAGSQIAMRRNILLISITKFVKKHIYEMQLDEMVFLQIVQMIRTFKLGANNVVFKPAALNIIALSLLNTLSLQDEALKEAIATNPALIYIKNIFKDFEESRSFCDKVYTLIKDVDIFVQEHK